MIERARQKREFEMSLPPITDEVGPNPDPDPDPNPNLNLNPPYIRTLTLTLTLTQIFVSLIPDP
jgi:hypothetical protein